MKKKKKEKIKNETRTRGRPEGTKRGEEGRERRCNERRHNCETMQKRVASIATRFDIALSPLAISRSRDLAITPLAPFDDRANPIESDQRRPVTKQGLVISFAISFALGEGAPGLQTVDRPAGERNRRAMALICLISFFPSSFMLMSLLSSLETLEPALIFRRHSEGAVVAAAGRRVRDYRGDHIRLSVGATRA